MLCLSPPGRLIMHRSLCTQHCYHHGKQRIKGLNSRCFVLTVIVTVGAVIAVTAAVCALAAAVAAVEIAATDIAVTVA